MATVCLFTRISQSTEICSGQHFCSSLVETSINLEIKIATGRILCYCWQNNKSLLLYRLTRSMYKWRPDGCRPQRPYPTYFKYVHYV